MEKNGKENKIKEINYFKLKNLNIFEKIN